MARPTKQTVDYFPHMCTHKKTMFIIEESFGNDGYSFWFKLLELLGSTEGHFYDCDDAANWEFLLAKTRLDENLCTQILDKLAILNAIDRELWQQDKIIWSDNFIDGITDAYKKRKVETPDKPCLRVQKLQLNGVSGDGNPQSKLKETKVNEITPIVPFGESPEIKPETIDCQDVVDEYNLICVKMPRAEKIQDDRRSSIKARIKEHGRNAITDVFLYASKSPHHNGENERGWTADFDWLMGPKNFRKMLERARSGTKPMTKQVQSKISSAMASSDSFLKKVKGYESRNYGQNFSNGCRQLPDPNV